MRVQHWPKLLAEYFQQAQTLKFEWGKSDCVLWCGEWVRRATGKDFVAGLGLSYDDETGAYETLNRLGYKSVGELVTAKLERISPRFAQRGDLVLFPTGSPVGISMGHRAMFLTYEGVTEAATLACPIAWKVE